MSNTPNCEPTARQAAGEPDPIFAAMERHRAARRGALDTYDRLGLLQEMIPEARRRWQIFDERPDDCSDAPEWIEANTAFLAAIEELAKALQAVLSTPPTNIAGVADLLDYIGRYESQPLAGEFPGNVLESAFKGTFEGVRKAAADFLHMIATMLPRRAAREPDPIFAAMERHGAALRGWLAARERYERPDDCSDAPEWIEDTALIEATEELAKALQAVLSTPPTTITGVADLLDHVNREQCELPGVDEYSIDLFNECHGTILEDALQGVSVEWVEEWVGVDLELQKTAADFLPMIAATLRTLVLSS